MDDMEKAAAYLDDHYPKQYLGLRHWLGPQIAEMWFWARKQEATWNKERKPDIEAALADENCSPEEMMRLRLELTQAYGDDAERELQELLERQGEYDYWMALCHISARLILQGEPIPPVLVEWAAKFFKDPTTPPRKPTGGRKENPPYATEYRDTIFLRMFEKLENILSKKQDRYCAIALHCQNHGVQIEEDAVRKAIDRAKT